MGKKKLAFVVVLLAMVLAGCKSGTPDYKKKLEVPVGPAPELVFSRYEDVLFNLDTADFQQSLKAVQPDFRPFLEGDLDNTEAVKYLKDFAVDPYVNALYRKVKEVFPDLKEVQSAVNGVYQHVKYYYPELQLPDRMYTCVSGLDQQMPPVLFFDDALVISLDWYLDGDELYERLGVPKYLSERTGIATLAKDLGDQVYASFIQADHRQTCLLDEMVYVGKRMYFIEAMCPSLPDQVLLGYNDTQMAWIDENEGNVWADLVGNQQLYASDYDLFRMFFSDGPFTNEYSHEAPPRLGEFLGLHIVRSYMGHCDCTLHELMQNSDLQGIFQDSKYKPKK